MLVDRSNRISPQKQMIKITYPSKNSSVSSKGGESQVRKNIVSPAQVVQSSPREA